MENGEVYGPLRIENGKMIKRDEPHKVEQPKHPDLPPEEYLTFSEGAILSRYHYSEPNGFTVVEVNTATGRQTVAYRHPREDASFMADACERWAYEAHHDGLGTKEPKALKHRWHEWGWANG